MKLADYLRLRHELAASAAAALPRARAVCGFCRRARSVCLCRELVPFASQARIAVLVHPQEARNRVGTARLVRLGITNSQLIVGKGPELDRSAELLGLLEEPGLQPFVLYPGQEAFDLDRAEPSVLRQQLDPARRPLIFVIDGTWSLAGKMIRRSRVLSRLPQLMFRPVAPSRYEFRRQPGQVCLSTVEAVHGVLERLDRLAAAPLGPGRPHDSLLKAFDRLVQTQLDGQSGKLGDARHLFGGEPFRESLRAGVE